MSKEQIVCLDDEALRAIVRSTRPDGKFWLEVVWAKDEIARRQKAVR